jgi:hypothetical protein
MWNGAATARYQGTTLTFAGFYNPPFSLHIGLTKERDQKGKTKRGENLEERRQNTMLHELIKRRNYIPIPFGTEGARRPFRT